MVVSIDPELVWVADDRTAGTAIQRRMLAQLLAEAVAQDLPYPVFVVWLSAAGGLEVVEWDGTAFVPTTRPLPAVPIDASRLHDLVPPILFRGTQVRRGRVFVVHLDDPLHLPPPADPQIGFQPGTVFDRVVLLTEKVPKVVRPEIKALLDSNVLIGDSVGFSAIVPSVLIPPPPVDSFWERWLGLTAQTFQARDEPEDDQLRRPGPIGNRMRLFRDACFVTVDLASLEVEWDARPAGVAFIDFIAGPGPDPDPRIERIHRWGRAVTNRRVGVAVSGGGACAYRLAGLLRRLEATQVPVDVVAGLSGGALIGAYYCTRGSAGLDRVIRNGPLFGLLLPLVTLSSWVMEKLVDFDLDAARIEETDVRFVAVTAELRSGRRPRSRVVSRGTVGEAVRASGTLPPMFGPTKKGGARYTDGGAASLVPAEVVRNVGADLTVSYNVIAGPPDGNPLRGLPLGEFVRDLPLVGRLIDLWVWYQFLWARASRQFGKHADVPIAFYKELQMMEAMFWMTAGSIADKGENDPEVQAGANEVLLKWQKLMIAWP